MIRQARCISVLCLINFSCSSLLYILYFTRMLSNYWSFIVILFVSAGLSILSRKLTIAGALTGGVIAWLIFIGAGYTGITMLATFFILASATADTLSSELGTVYGRKFYNIITFKKATRGLDGVISVEGTIIGIMGSALIAIIYSIGFGYTSNFFRIIIAGTTGNIAD